MDDIDVIRSMSRTRVKFCPDRNQCEFFDDKQITSEYVNI